MPIKEGLPLGLDLTEPLLPKNKMQEEPLGVVPADNLLDADLASSSEQVENPEKSGALIDQGRASPHSTKSIKGFGISVGDISREYERWPETAGFPPIHGGSGEEDKETARQYIRNYFERKWNRRKEEKEMNKVLREINRLRKEYPGLYEEVVREQLEMIRRAKRDE